MPTPTHPGGPKTPEGKKKSSLNALKHGLTAKSPHAFDKLAEISEVSFDEVLAEMVQYYQPDDPVERQLVKRIARCVWRLGLSATMEERVLENRPGATRPSVSYERILKYERLVDIHLHRALSALKLKRELPNKKNSQNELPPASDLSVSQA